MAANTVAQVSWRAPSIRGLQNASYSESFSRATNPKSQQPRKPSLTPLNFDYRAATADTARTCGKDRYPELAQLFDSGTLVCITSESKEGLGGRSTAGALESHAGDGSRMDALPKPPPAREIFLIGTAHISKQSAADVAKVIDSIRPDNVVVELCSSRAALMYQPDADADGSMPSRTSSGNAGLAEAREKETSNFSPEQAGSTSANPLLLSGRSGIIGTLTQTLQRGGRSAMALRLLLAFTAQKASLAAGVPSGVEFQAARKAAEAAGAQLVLGDRPIEITLRRAWSALPLGERVRLVFAFLRGSALLSSPSAQALLSEEALARLQTEDGQMSALFRAMGQQFPSLMLPLVHERDAYMAWVLRYSQAVRGSQRVVGVVGRGHLPGIVHCLLEDNSGRVLFFKEVAGVGDRSELRPQDRAKMTAFRLFVEVAVGLLCWYAFSQWNTL